MAHCFGIQLSALLGEAHDEGQGDQTEEQGGEDYEGVLVAEHGGLELHLAVGHGDCCLRGLFFALSV